LDYFTALVGQLSIKQFAHFYFTLTEFPLELVYGTEKKIHLDLTKIKRGVVD